MRKFFSQGSSAVILSALAFAACADVGIGASVESDEATIYVPVTFESGFMLEPYVRYANDTESRADLGRVKSENAAFGVGLFGTSAPADQVSVYYGARLAYLRDDSVSTITNFITGLPVGERRDERDGFAIAPTVGLQYHFSSRVAIGAEIGWEYSDTDGQVETVLSNQVPSASIGTSRTRRESRAEVILRFFF